MAASDLQWVGVSGLTYLTAAPGRDDQLPIASENLVQKGKRKQSPGHGKGGQAILQPFLPPRPSPVPPQSHSVRAYAGGTALNVHRAHCMKCEVKEKVNKPLVTYLKKKKKRHLKIAAFIEAASLSGSSELGINVCLHRKFFQTANPKRKFPFQSILAVLLGAVFSLQAV